MEEGILFLFFFISDVFLRCCVIYFYAVGFFEVFFAEVYAYC